MKPLRIADMHQDISFAIKTGGFDAPANKDLAVTFDKDLPGRHGDIPKYLRGGVRLIFGAIFPAYQSWSPAALERLERLYGSWHGSLAPLMGGLRDVVDQLMIYRGLAKKYEDKIQLVHRPGDLERLLGSERIGILVSLEGSDPLERPEDLEILHLLGIRSLTLTWNYNNRYASSCTSTKDYGLTQEGEELVRMANQLGIILDISHAGKRTALDVLSISKMPVIASHSNYSKIHKHPRNVDDEILEEVKRIGGVVGFTLITSTIGPRQDVESLANHVIEVQRSYGSEVLGIGTDFFGIEKTPQGLEDASKIPNLLEKLAEKGLGDGDLEKMAWGNVERVVKIHEKAWAHD